jgi:mono/diheme cytochrome c family protein
VKSKPLGFVISAMITIFGIFCQSCAQKSNPKQSAAAVAATSNPTDGAALYLANCTTSGCHANPPTFVTNNQVAASPYPNNNSNTSNTQAQGRAFVGIDLYSIDNAIRTKPVMQFLQSRINQTQMTSISLYLTQVKTSQIYNPIATTTYPYPTGNTAQSGEALYNQYCSRCHGTSNSVSPKVSQATAEEIRTAVTFQPQMRTSELQSLVLQNQTQLQAIVEFLRTR